MFNIAISNTLINKIIENHDLFVIYISIYIPFTILECGTNVTFVTSMYAILGLIMYFHVLLIFELLITMLNRLPARYAHYV